MSIKIIKVQTEEELTAYKRMTAYAFAPTPTHATYEEEEQREDFFEKSTRYVLYKDEKPVSTLHAIEMTENVRGKIFNMQGIAGVSTYPEERRQGYIKRLVGKALEDAKENGEVFSTLYPFRQSFYGRFGYINFPQARFLKSSPAKFKDIRNFKIRGIIERYLISEQIDRYYQFLNEYQKHHHGFGLFHRSKEEDNKKRKQWIVFATIDGKDQGLMTFSSTGFEKELRLSLFLYHTSEAKYLLLDHLSRHVDQFSEIQMRILPHERPETWFYDGNFEIKNRDWVPSPMGRIVDIEGMNGMQVGTGFISIKVDDEHCPWNNRVWHFKSDDGVLEVTKAEKADVTMTIQGLSALVYGCYELEDLVVRGWLTSDELIESLQALFPPKIPGLWAVF